jgi:hypothetical protein
MNFDPSSWIDESHYSDLSVIVNYLQAQGLDNCSMGPEGPNGFFPSPDYVVQLGKVRYQVTLIKDRTPGSVIGYYIDTNSLPEYDYKEKGIVKLAVEARSSEWDNCKRLAETVLSTLHFPD